MKDYNKLIDELLEEDDLRTKWLKSLTKKQEEEMLKNAKEAYREYTNSNKDIKKKNKKGKNK